jgi:hypothetical protein
MFETADLSISFNYTQKLSFCFIVFVALDINAVDVVVVVHDDVIDVANDVVVVVVLVVVVHRLLSFVLTSGIVK